MKDRRAWLALGLLSLGVLGYHLSWFENATAGFTMHAWDLAEWASIHPAVRASAPPMLTSFLLRFPLAAILFLAATAANWLPPRARALILFAAIVLALRFVPPREFFGASSGDPNYRQMGLLVLVALVGILIGGLVGTLDRWWQTAAFTAITAAAVGAGWWGLARAAVLLDSFEIDVAIGIGPLLLSAALALASGLMLMPARGSRRVSKHDADPS